MIILIFWFEIKLEVEEYNVYIIINIFIESSLLILIYYEIVLFVLNLLWFLIDIKFCFDYSEMNCFYILFFIVVGGM